MSMLKTTSALIGLLVALSVMGQDEDPSAVIVRNFSTLTELYEQGVISESEFNAAQLRLLNLLEKEVVDASLKSDIQSSSGNILTPQSDEVGLLVSKEINLISELCLKVFEKDINFVRERSAIADAYFSPILSHGARALSGGVNADVDRAKRDLLIAERDQKLNAVNSLRNNLINENSSCFNF